MKHKFDITTIIVSFALLAALLIGTIFMPDSVVAGLVDARAFIIRYLGSFFIIFVAAMLIYNLWLVFSKYGSIRLGKVTSK